MSGNLDYTQALLGNLLYGGRADRVSVDLASHWQRLREQALSDLNDSLLDTLVERGFDEEQLLNCLQRLVDKRRLQLGDGNLDPSARQ